MKNKTITMSKKELKELIRKEIEKDKRKPIVISISKKQLEMDLFNYFNDVRRSLGVPERTKPISLN